MPLGSLQQATLYLLTLVSFQDIDHTSYAQRSFEFAPFNYLQGVLCSSIFKESDVNALNKCSPPYFCFYGNVTPNSLKS